MVTVVVLGDERTSRLWVVVVQPQIRVCSRLVALSVAVAVDNNEGAVRIYREMPVRLCGDGVRVSLRCAPVEESEQPDN